MANDRKAAAFSNEEVDERRDGHGATPSTADLFAFRGEQAPEILTQMMSFSAVPLEAWARTILTPREIARKRRIQAIINIIKTGTADIEGLMLVDMAARLSQDGTARAQVERMYTGRRGISDRIMSRFTRRNEEERR